MDTLRREGNVKETNLQMQNCVFSTDLAVTGNAFQRVGAATKNTLLSISHVVVDPIYNWLYSK